MFYREIVMKKITAALLALCLLGAGGCSSAPGSPPPAPTDGALPANAAEISRFSAAGAELALLLSELASQRGAEAGQAPLSPAVTAARLLDLQQAATPGEEDIILAVRRSLSALSPEQAEAFPEKLRSVWREAYGLCSPPGGPPPVLSGYEPQNWPWSREQAESLFSALFGALDRPLPEP